MVGRELYRIMIVDDEPDMREGIVQCVPWGELGYQVAAEAENGQDALDKAENIGVDIILTDIKMPFMDGLTLARRMSILHPSVKIIILSGFDEFEYAKEAISLNVAEYVLKPINAVELSKVLVRVRERMDEEFAKQSNIDLLTESYEQTRPLIQERFLIELLWGTLSEDEASRRLGDYNPKLKLAERRMVTVFQPEDMGREGAISGELIPFSVTDMVRAQVEGRCAYHILQMSNMVVLVTAWDEPFPYNQVISLAGEICARCGRVLETVLNAGIGRTYHEVSALHKSFVEARRALEYKEIIGTGRAIYIGDMEHRHSGRGKHEIQSEEYFFRLLKFGSEQQIENLVEELTQQLSGAEALERRAYMTGVFHSLYRLSQYHGIYDDEKIREELRWFTAAVDQWDDLTAMMNWLHRVCILVRDVISENRKTSTRSLADKAVHYLEAHYTDSSLSVEQMCERLHLSQSYFSTVFKQETGQSFIRYLTELRMNRAIELLEDTEKKTYEIATAVGYDEPNYFSYVFKKHFGISPSKYRAQRKERNE